MLGPDRTVRLCHVRRAAIVALSGRPGTLCIRRDSRTPLVVRPMQAVSAGPRRAPRSILPLTPSSRLKRGPTRRLRADAGGDEGVSQNDRWAWHSTCTLRLDSNSVRQTRSFATAHNLADFARTHTTNDLLEGLSRTVPRAYDL